MFTIDSFEELCFLINYKDKNRKFGGKNLKVSHLGFTLISGVNSLDEIIEKFKANY